MFVRFHRQSRENCVFGIRGYESAIEIKRINVESSNVIANEESVLRDQVLLKIKSMSNNVYSVSIILKTLSMINEH